MTEWRTYRLIAGLMVVVLAGAILASGPAGAADHTVAVAVFYAPTPLPSFPSMVPEQYAAANLTVMLAAAAGGRITIVPRDQVMVKESELHWREADVLQFARLGELAHAVGADRVVVGWIRVLTWNAGGSGGRADIMGGGNAGIRYGLADVVYQVFDAAQGRIVYETRAEGHSVGGTLTIVAQATLDDAGQRGAAQLLGPLSGPSAP
jgi:hypothetical protein